MSQIPWILKTTVLNCMEKEGRRKKKGQRGIKPEMTHTQDFEDSGREGMYIPSAEFELRGWFNGCRVS